MAIKYSFVIVCLFTNLLVLAAEATKANSKLKVFNVKDYGAIADAKKDNSQEFLKAWSEACKWGGRAKVWIPEGNYMLNSVIFQGPCKGVMDFVIKGVLMAPTDPSLFNVDKWINFKYVQNLIVSGGGILDGQGAVAWPHNQCSKNSNCPPLPTTMRFDFITNSQVDHINSINSKNNHIMIFGCERMTLTNINISAPQDSPNTGGIKIGSSHDIIISRSTIGTGDDCISIISGTKNVSVSDVTCGPGHGISVGSLGKGDWEEDVGGIVVSNCTFHGTSNCLGIKTWAAPLKKPLMASNFVYEDIVMDNVENPILIDQYYCPDPPCNTQEASDVQISGVRFTNIKGSCKSDVAVNLNCSKEHPCQDIRMQDINLWSSAGGGRKLSNLCSNVQGSSYGTQIPPSCI